MSLRTRLIPCLTALPLVAALACMSGCSGTTELENTTGLPADDSGLGTDASGNADTSQLDGALPDGTLPDGTVSDGTVSDGTLPDGMLPDGTVSDGTLPDGTEPDGAPVDGASYDGTIGDAAGGRLDLHDGKHLQRELR